MKLLDGYIIKEILKPFFFGIGAFTLIISGSTILFQVVSNAAKYGFTMFNAVQLFMYKLPGIITLTMPMALLLSTILVIGRMSSDLEVIALRSAGVSFFRLLLPLLMLGFLISLLNILFNEIVVPKANHHYETLYKRLKNTSVSIKQNVNLTQYDAQGYPLRIINVKEVKNDVLNDITLAEYDDGTLARLIRAKTGEWNAQVGWELNDGVMHVLLKDSIQRLIVIEFEKEIINIQLNLLELSRVDKSHEEMNAQELKQFILKEKVLGKNINELLIQYYFKFSIPFSCLIFAMIGAAVSFQPNQRSSTMSMGLSILIIVLYYIVYSISLVIGMGGTVPSYIAAWIPNFIVAVVSLYYLNRILTH